MKKPLVTLVCFLLSRLVNAQIPALALDEHNKYVYYQVIDLPGFSADSLYKNSVYFIQEAYPKKKPEHGNSSIMIRDKFLTYTTLIKHESGEISYTLNIECKDSKYRYWLTDFQFTPYQRDRYGVFVATPGINLPLETAASKIDKKELDSYLSQTAAFCTGLSEQLKKYMADGHSVKKIDHQPAKILTDKW
jgi:Domain of unknown function (DUF4468) with TBP-like fold